jgi:hypothetical protein
MFTRKNGVSRHYLADVCDKLSNVTALTDEVAWLRNLSNADVFWDKIIEIKEIDCPYQFVFDFSVKDDEIFVGGNGSVVVHNSWKSLSAGRAFMETLLADGWTCIYITITADWMGIQFPNKNPLDIETLRYFHSHWFLQEAGWRTHGVPKDRITLMVSPFWRGNVKELEEQYGLTTCRCRIPMWNVMIEAMADFYGAGSMTDAGYFKDIRELWEDLRSKRTPVADFLASLHDIAENMPSGQKEWGEKFVRKIDEWTKINPDPILTEENMLEDMLGKKGRLLIFYLPQEEITNIEAATVSTFLYTIMDVCQKHYRKTGIKYCVIVDDVGTFKNSERFRQAMEVFIQRKGRKCGMVRVIIGQTDEDLENTTVKDTTQTPTFDFRIDTSINNVEIGGLQVLRGGASFLHLRKKVFTRKGKRSYHPLLYVSRPPLTAYHLLNQGKEETEENKENKNNQEMSLTMEEFRPIYLQRHEKIEEELQPNEIETEYQKYLEATTTTTEETKEEKAPIEPQADASITPPIEVVVVETQPSETLDNLDNCLKEPTPVLPLPTPKEQPMESLTTEFPCEEPPPPDDQKQEPEKQKKKRKRVDKYQKYSTPNEDGTIDGVTFFTVGDR